MKRGKRSKRRHHDELAAVGLAVGPLGIGRPTIKQHHALQALGLPRRRSRASKSALTPQERLQRHKERYRAVTAGRTKGLTFDQAFRQASESLRATRWQGTENAMRLSYAKVVRELRAASRDLPRDG